MKSPLAEKILSSKLLKETMFESKYDFEGVFGDKPASCKK